MKVSRKQLRQLIREEIGSGEDRAGSGLPNARDLARKLSSVAPDEALSFLARVLNNMTPASAPAAEENPMPPAPPVEDE